MPKSAKNKIYNVAVPVADLLDHPGNGAKIGRRDSQFLFGESFKAESNTGAWIYGTSLVDGYKGYVHKSALKLQTTKPSHTVGALLTQLYPKPDFKTRPVMSLSFMSRVHVTGVVRNGFVQTPHGWIFKDHLKKNKDYMQAALMFLGCPYLYGGRSVLGLDCSALVQLTLSSAGIPCQRDSDQQVSVGRKISSNILKRGDLVFFKGHVGLMVDSKNILNATARTMDTRIEDLAKLTSIYKGIIAARRL
jgi:cell wall-associated NlpC family hydrolase